MNTTRWSSGKDLDGVANGIQGHPRFDNPFSIESVRLELPDQLQVTAVSSNPAPLIEEDVLHDAVHPAVQPGSLGPLAETRDGPFASRLNQVVGIVDGTREASGEAPEPGQKRDQVVAETAVQGGLRSASFVPPLTITSLAAFLIPRDADWRADRR